MNQTEYTAVKSMAHRWEALGGMEGSIAAFTDQDLDVVLSLRFPCGCGGSEHKAFKLTPKEARHIARALNAAARTVEAS
jgi:hypothetical protein